VRCYRLPSGSRIVLRRRQDTTTEGHIVGTFDRLVSEIGIEWRTVRTAALAGSLVTASMFVGTAIASADISLGPVSVGASGTTSGQTANVSATPPVGVQASGTLSNDYSTGQKVSVNALAGLISATNISNSPSGQTVSTGVTTGGLLCTCAVVTISNSANGPSVTISHNP
jgi:hypothetical protein